MQEDIESRLWLFILPNLPFDVIRVDLWLLNYLWSIWDSKIYAYIIILFSLMLFWRRFVMIEDFRVLTCPLFLLLLSDHKILSPGQFDRNLIALMLIYRSLWSFLFGWFWFLRSASRKFTVFLKVSENSNSTWGKDVNKDGN